jgi:hypothetical protein
MLKLSPTSKSFGTPVRCPACRHPNLGIDIWCERCGTPLDWQRGAADGAPEAPGVPLSAPPRPLPALAAMAPTYAALPEIVAPEPPDPPAAPAMTSRTFCPTCGAANAADGRYCSRCGSAMTPPPARRAPVFALPGLSLRLPRLTLPSLSVGRPVLPRLPRTAWIVATIVAVLLIAPLAYVLFPNNHTVAAVRSGVSGASATGTATVASNSAEAAAIPGVEAKTGLRFSASCKPNVACLSLARQIAGQEAAAVVFSTAAPGGRQCAGYVYRAAGTWHLLDTVCALPAQLTPLVGRDATVHVPGNCANLRAGATVNGRVVACLYDGSKVHISGGPTYADGRIWWRDPRGWIAHDFLVG